jgi:hypothetical protein
VAAYRGLFGAGAPCSEGGDFRVVLTRWDSQGVQGSEADLGCYPEGTEGRLATNVRGDVVAVYGGQWWHLAPDGTLTHHPFDRQVGLLPLIDGRFAMHDGTWSTVDAEGTASPDPSWLASRTDPFEVNIVLGGTAYVLHHWTDDCSRSLELVLEDGTGCGFIPVPGPSQCTTDSVAVGLDGTISAVETGSCTMFVWKGALGPALTP